MQKKRLLLCILDGWGYSQQTFNNAITAQTAPFFTHIIEQSPYALLKAHGDAVGLPDHIQGSSEVGHTTIGAGCVYDSIHKRISDLFNHNTLNNFSAWNTFSQNIKASGSVHCVSLITTGGVHADISHLTSLASILRETGVTIYLHAILDGRDCPKGSAFTLLKQLLEEHKNIKIASLIGRDHAMDRSQIWSKTYISYKAIIHAQAPTFKDPFDVIHESFDQEEFLLPHVAEEYSTFNYAQDHIIFLNYRSDRMQQITQALCDPAYKGSGQPSPQPQPWLSITQYKNINTIEYLLKPSTTFPALGHYLKEHKLTQARIAESEKSFHITHFFDGQNFQQDSSIDTFITPSFPDASSIYSPVIPTNAITRFTLDALEQSYDFILVNYAAPDLVGHTGNLQEAENGIANVDRALSHVVSTAQEHNVTVVITADHGNVEYMQDEGKPYTGHTTNPVPFIVISPQEYSLTRTNGELSDVAPTLLEFFAIPIPKHMKGQSLCKW